MSTKKKKQVTSEVMKKIHKGEVKMKPKVYFVVGSALAGAGLAVAIGFSVLAFHAMYLRLSFLASLGVEGLEWRWLNMMIHFFPWGLMLGAAALVALGLYLISQYEVGYRNGLLGTLVGLLAGVLVLTWVMNQIGVVQHLRQQPRLHQFFEEQEVPRGLNEWRMMHGLPLMPSPGRVQGVMHIRMMR